VELHRLVRHIHTAPEEPGARRTLEDALLKQARHRGAQTLREFGLFHKAHSRDELAMAVKSLVSSGELVATEGGKATRFHVGTEVSHEV
jgi:hypothetical protein